MSTGEICWRVGLKLTECFDRCVAAARRVPLDLERVADDGSPARALAINHALFGPLPEPGALSAGAWCDVARLAVRAEAILENRLTLFDLEDHPLGDPVCWNYEYKAGRAAPAGFAPDIDYRDHTVTGDCKFVWEPNRHQHLVVLGRAYRATGNPACARHAVRHIDSWLEQCPFGTGMNWRSPLELAIRLINWVWTLELIRPAGVIPAETAQRVTAAAYQHLWEISRKYSRYSSANNHLIGEAAGVFIGASCFSRLRRAGQWQQEARAILLREILTQTFPDGGTREQALGYHQFVLEFFLLADVAARRLGIDFPPEYRDRLARMVEFLSAMREGGDLPMFGDADDGYVLDLGGRLDPDALLTTGALVLDRPDLLPRRPVAEPACWLLGPEAAGRAQVAADASPGRKLASRAFSDSGYYLLQTGTADTDAMSVLFDCGELGFGPIAAHGHADALSVTVRAFGRDVLVDPGTYDYFTYPAWRDYFRGTRAHNTIRVDRVEQSEMLGPFLWGKRVKPRCLQWEPAESGGCVAGEIGAWNGSGLVHRRTVSLDGASRTVLLRDELQSAGHHVAEAFFHFAEWCEVEAVEPGAVTVRIAGGKHARLLLDRRWSVEVLRGSEAPMGGWVSRGYHRRSPAPMVIARCEWMDRLETVTRLVLC